MQAVIAIPELYVLRKYADAGNVLTREVAGVPVRGMQWTAFTFPFNLTGQPAASVPCGWTAQGLPVGLQVVGRRNDDASVLRACAAPSRAGR